MSLNDPFPPSTGCGGACAHPGLPMVPVSWQGPQARLSCCALSVHTPCVRACVHACAQEQGGQQQTAKGRTRQQQGEPGTGPRAGQDQAELGRQGQCEEGRAGSARRVVRRVSGRAGQKNVPFFWAGQGRQGGTGSRDRAGGAAGEGRGRASSGQFGAGPGQAGPAERALPDRAARRSRGRRPRGRALSRGLAQWRTTGRGAATNDGGGALGRARPLPPYRREAAGSSRGCGTHRGARTPQHHPAPGLRTPHRAGGPPRDPHCQPVPHRDAAPGPRAGTPLRRWGTGGARGGAERRQVEEKGSSWPHRPAREGEAEEKLHLIFPSSAVKPRTQRRAAELRRGDAVLLRAWPQPHPTAIIAAVSFVPCQCWWVAAARSIAALAPYVWGQAVGPAFPHGTVAMGAALSTGAVVAISFNCVIALLILILFLILCKACRTPSCPKKSPASDTDEARNEEKYLLQP